jgi:hypothetical protein
MKKLIRVACVVTLVSLIGNTIGFASMHKLTDLEMAGYRGKDCGPCVPATSNCDGNFGGKHWGSPGMPGGGSVGGCSGPAWGGGKNPILGCLEDGCSNLDAPPNIVNGSCVGIDKTDCSLMGHNDYWPNCLTLCHAAVAGICACTASEDPNNQAEYPSQDCANNPAQ